MKKRLIAGVLSCVMMLSLLAGCGNSNSNSNTSTPTPGSSSPASQPTGEIVSSRDTLVLSIAEDPSRLRSDTIRGLNTRVYKSIVYDYLFKTGDDGSYEPYLCESYKVDEDGLGVTLYLVSGVKFHDGNVMTAEDVLASLEIGKQDTNYGSNMTFIDFDNSKVVDDTTLYLKFSEKNSVWQGPLVSLGIIEKAAYEASSGPDEFYANPMTTSSYMLKDWVSGDSLTFEAFEDYYQGAPKIKNIVLRVITESAVALMELTTGGIDVFYNMSKENYQNASELPGIVCYDGQPSPTSVFVGFNLKNKALNDLRVRQAIMCAVDLDSIVLGAMDGAAKPCYSMLGVSALGYDPYWENNYPYPYDVERAKQLLADAGYPDGGGLTFRIIVDQTAKRQLMAEQMLNMLADVGITLDIQKYDQATATDIVSNTDEYDMYIRGISVNEGDSITNLTTTVGTSATHMELDKEHYKDWQEITTEILSEMDQSKRADGYQKLQKAFIEDMVYWLPGVLADMYSAYTDQLEGVDITGGYWYWTNAYFK